MEKMGEEELKGLEEEIEDAVNRLFVEKKRGGPESILRESPSTEPLLKTPVMESPIKSPVIEPDKKPLILESSMEPSMELSMELSMETSMEPPGVESLMPPHTSEPTPKPFILEPLIEPLSEPSLSESSLSKASAPPPVPIPFLKSIEKMEVQLLSLEWEISEEKLQKTREEVLALRDSMKQKTDISSILNWMDQVLIHMMNHDENILPPWIKFLLDSKETIKLLMRKDAGKDIHIYQQLAYQGIEARFSGLEGMKETPVFSAPIILEKEKVKEEIFIQSEKKIKDAMDKMNDFSGKMDEFLGKIEPYLSKINQSNSEIAAPLDDKSFYVNFTIFKVNGKLLGVESKKVFKLFKVPNTFREKYSNHTKVRLRDLEVKMINLRELLSIHGGGPKEEVRILTVQDNGEYKGFMIDQVLKKLSTVSDRAREVGEYFSGIIHFTYQEQPMEIPVLDLKKF